MKKSLFLILFFAIIASGVIFLDQTITAGDAKTKCKNTLTSCLKKCVAKSLFGSKLSKCKKKCQDDYKKCLTKAVVPKFGF